MLLPTFRTRKKNSDFTIFHNSSDTLLIDTHLLYLKEPHRLHVLKQNKKGNDYDKFFVP